MGRQWGRFMPPLIGFLFGLLCTYSINFLQPSLPLELCQRSLSFARQSCGERPKSSSSDSSGQEVRSFQRMEKELAQEVRKSTRILCWIMSQDKNSEKRAAVLKTWGRRCDTLLFMIGGAEGNATEERLSKNAFLVKLNLKEHYNALWKKTRLSFQHIEARYKGTYDWALKIDDDSYVIMENLKLYLRSKDPAALEYYGCPYKSMGGYNSGGPGYVLSVGNVEKLVEAFGRSGCAKDSFSGPEDVEVAKCLRLVGINKADTRDEKGRFRFSPFEPLHTMHHALLPPQFKWFWGFTAFTLNKGWECCSDEFISFHYITPEMMATLEYLIYYVHPFSSRDSWDET